jgi:energy-coupling factor transporter ATP-binding protein EcfA2
MRETHLPGARQMAHTDFLGAKASNAGDSFHELWALHAALDLVRARTTLVAVTVEGVRAIDAVTASDDAWSGVDCALYFDGDSFSTARRIELIQLKYSSANSDKNWTVAGLTASTSKTKNNSVIRRLANQFVAAHAQRQGDSAKETVVKFVTNRPIAPEVTSALASLGQKPKRNTAGSQSIESVAQKNLGKFRAATGLKIRDFAVFCQALELEGGVNSRFALKEELLLSIGAWTNSSSRTQLDDLLQFVRDHMMPESRRDLIRRESILARFGVSDRKSLFPCPPDLKFVQNPISRPQASEVIRAISSGGQRLCLHGEGGCGKTTLLQEIRTLIPVQSNSVVFDCYGGGTYLDSNAYRHRERDAFTQLTNEIAAMLGAPLFLLPLAQTDFPRVFMERLVEAAALQELIDPESLLLVAIDAADNAVSAGKACKPPQESFISSVANLGVLPRNVVLIITARTGRLDSLELPSTFDRIPVATFTLDESAAHVRSYWPDLSDQWIQEFHELSSQNPRVQSYALDAGRRSGNRNDSMQYLLPAGKGLDEVFRRQIQDAIVKAGTTIDVRRFCAAVVSLPRPIPLDFLSGVTELSNSQIADICNDLAPGIVIRNAELSLADEDFERFLDQESSDSLPAIRSVAAEHLWSKRNTTIYAATHVAALLLDADRGNDLVTLLQTEKEPAIISDPILRREVQLQRLKLGIRICDELKAPVDAVKTLVIGTEAINTDDVIRKRLEQNPDLAAACSAERASTLVLRDPNAYHFHGGLLFHLYRQDARVANLLQARARQRQLNAWMKRRSAELETRDENRYARDEWPIATRDIAASIEADLLLYGPEIAIGSLRAWSPRTMLPGLLLAVTESLLSAGRHDLVTALYSSESLLDAWKVFIFVPCAMAGLTIPLGSLVRGLLSLAKRSSGLVRNQTRGVYNDTEPNVVPELLLRGCEIAVVLGTSFQTLEHVFALYENPFQRSRDRFSAHDARTLDRTFRAISIRVRAGGASLDASQFWLDKQDDPSDKAKQANERKGEQDAYVNSLCKAYSTRADILLGNTVDPGFSQSIVEMQTNAALNHYEIRRQYEAGRLRSQFAGSLTVLMPVAAMDTTKLLQAAIAVIGEQARFATEEHLAALGPFRCRAELHETLLAQVNAWTADLSGRKIPASERIDSMVRLARFVLGISSASAGAMFIKSLEFASDIDEDVLLQIRVLVALARVAAPNLAIGRRNELGRVIICVAGDAILRLDDLREFDWSKFSRGLTELNPSVALAAASRWEDFGILRREQLLPGIVRQGLVSKTISVAQACALAALIDDGESGFLETIFDASQRETVALKRAQVVEILAWEDLFRFGRGYSDGLAKKLVAGGYVQDEARWAKSLTTTVSFLSAMDQSKPSPSDVEEAPSGLSNWNIALSFDTAEDLRDAIQKAQQEAEARGGSLRYDTNYIFDSVFQKVPVGRHVNVLSALCQLFASDRQHSADSQLVRALARWANDPAVEQWCATNLPEFIRANLLRLGQWVRYGQSIIHKLIELTRLDSRQITNLILSGLAANAEGLYASLALPLVELLVTQLEADDAVILSEWYSGRLVQHIPANERDLIDAADVPVDSASGVARYLYALMTDVDTRIRWKAAHAFCRLAILGDAETIASFSPQVSRSSDKLFRQPDAPFYELGGRLWFVIALDRACRESPHIVASLADDLRKMIDASSIPHVLIRGFARTNLLRLAKAGAISLSKAERSALTKVNKSPLAAKAREDVPRDERVAKRETKHRFDPMDTIPSWYSPMVACFADVTMDEFLSVADKWVSEEWKVSPDIGVWKDEKRLNRYPEREWGLWSNSHGSEPVIERPALYYEWHAMWCTVGELLATRPLAAVREGWSYGSLERRTHRAMLSDPHHWLSELRMPKPLEARFWNEPPSDGNIRSWLDADDSAYFLNEIGIRPNIPEIVVDGRHETQAHWFRSDVHIRSALVSPDRALSLLRALETADHYRYFVPPEEHNLEIESDGYTLRGWLKSIESEGEGIDDRDTFRASISPHGHLPGTAVTRYFNLKQQISEEGHIVGDKNETIFLRELWSDETAQDNRRHRYGERPISSGERLKIDKRRLQEFLTVQGFDLIVHVEQTRADRGYGYGESSSKEEKQIYNRHFVLRANRIYEDAFGNSGAW